jgi:hypothetical protein
MLRLDFLEREVPVKIQRNIRLNLIIVALVTACSLGLASVARADNLTINDSRYLGSITPGTPASPGDQVGFINHLIDLAPGTQNDVFGGNTYDRSNVPCVGCPDAVLAGNFRDDAAPFNPINLGNGWQYLLAKYGLEDHVWNISGLTGGGHTIPTEAPGGGLSHYTLFNPGTTVPEPNSLLLLGSAITLLGLARRWFRK